MVPCLHTTVRGLYNPLTHRELVPGGRGFDELMALVQEATRVDSVEDSLRRQLVDDEWLVPEETDIWHRFYLRVVALETHTVCNQACSFCPVAYAPRDPHYMPDELFERIADQLAEYRATLEAIFLMSYNEPTIDKRLAGHCASLIERGLPVAINTNGSGLTPKLADSLVEIGPLRFLSVNLNTVDPQRYRRERGKAHLDIVLKNLRYVKNLRVADEMVIAVLGEGDEQHEREVEAISRMFAGSNFEVRNHRLMDRAGYLEVGDAVPDPAQALRGCENLGSRPIQHLHITPHGRCVLCCEDYDEHYVVGNLIEETVVDVLTGDRLAQLRRWTYGAEEAPADFICRECVFALRR